MQSPPAQCSANVRVRLVSSKKEEYSLMEAALNGPQGRITLGSAPLRLGRAQDNDIVVSDPQASSHHAEIAPGLNGTNYALTDLGSTNGTFVNEQLLTPRVARPLRSGDVIRIGGTSFSFEVAGSAEATVRASSPSPALDATIIGSPSSSPPSQLNYPSPSYSQQATGDVPPSQSGYPQQGEYPQQPGYPQQGGYQQPPQIPGYPQQPGIPSAIGAPLYQPPKKSRAGLWIALVLVAIVVIGGAFGVWYLNRSTPQKTLDAACTAIKNNDAEGFYNLFSQRVQAKTKLDD